MCSVKLSYTFSIFFQSHQSLPRHTAFILSLSVLFSQCCCNKISQIWQLKTTQIYFYTVLNSYSSIGQKSDMSLTRLNSSSQQGCVPFGGCKRESILCHSRLLESTSFLGMWPLPPSNPAAAGQLLLPSPHSDIDSLLPCSFTFRNSCYYTGPTQIIQDISQGLLISTPNSICSIDSLCHVTYIHKFQDVDIFRRQRGS